MFKTLRFLFIASVIAGAVAWMLDNNGSIVINWLGYEAKTDVLTAILLLLFFTLIIFVSSYAIARLKAIKVPHFSKLFNKKHDQ